MTGWRLPIANGYNSMHRFFIENNTQHSLAIGETLLLPDNLAHQVRDVLHLTPGERLILLDNSGDELTCTIRNSTKMTIEVQVVARQRGKSESPVRIVLCQGLLKSARFEWILEKGTELGVSTFAPILCRRSMSGLEEVGSAKLQRWQRILQEATEQCGRARRPTLLPVRSLAQTLQTLPADLLALIPWEEERRTSLYAALQEPSIQNALTLRQSITVLIFIGPEGGLELEEVELARQYGVISVSLGHRIMRAETAALAAVAAIMYELEARFDV